MKYTIDYFIQKFNNIPDEKWCVGTFTEDSSKFLGLITSNKYCAQGHCGVKDRESAKYIWNLPLNENIEASVLYHLFGGNIKTKNEENTIVAIINNGKHPQYQQETPRLRLIAALEDMKNGTYPHMKGEYWNKYKSENLKTELKKAEESEDYEKAALIKKQIEAINH